MSYTVTASYTYSVVDIETTFRRLRADLLMIADSTKAITREEAEIYTADAEYLACKGFLKHVDVTQMVGTTEQRAVRYSVSEQASGWTSSRPGGVLWPALAGGWIRVVLTYTDAYTPEKRESAKRSLKLNWTPTDADISHVSLTQGAGRNYVSNAYGLQRNDYS